MATVTITVPDAVAKRVIDAFEAVFAADVNAGIVGKALVEKKLRDFVREVVAAQEANTAAEAARKAAVEKAQADITLS